MTNCFDTDQLATLAAVLGPAPQERAQHLVDCDSCQRALLEIGQLQALFQQGVAANNHVIDRVVTAIRRDAVSPVKRRATAGAVEVLLTALTGVAALLLTQSPADWDLGLGGAQIAAAAALCAAWALAIGLVRTQRLANLSERGVEV